MGAVEGCGAEEAFAAYESDAGLGAVLKCDGDRGDAVLEEEKTVNSTTWAFEEHSCGKIDELQREALERLGGECGKQMILIG